MKVAIVHTDFRIYWPARLNVLHEHLKIRGISLDIVEISGMGSTNGFALNQNPYPNNWHCLFPDKRMEDIRPAHARSAVIRKLIEIIPDIVISGPIAFPSGAAAVFWTLKNNRKIILFDDARLSDVPRPWFVNKIKKKVYQCVDAVFCPSPEWINTFTHFGFNREQIFYGVDVVDNSFWINFNHDVASPVTGKYFLAVGRQVPKKNFMFLIKAYSNYVKLVKEPLQLEIIGEGPEGKSLMTFVYENKLEARIHFHPFMPQENLKPFYHNAEWFILPSKFGETWGLVVNEAMASGLPVLVSNQAGCSSTLVKDRGNGFSFSPVDENELTELLIIAGEMPEGKRKSMGEKSLEVISGWGLDRFCSGIDDAIDYVSKHSRNEPDIFSKMIIKFWKGRYRLE